VMHLNTCHASNPHRVDAHGSTFPSIALDFSGDHIR
jgi:hypothetical protein